MAEALILDAEAVNAMARARDRGVLAERARAIARVALERQALVRVPSVVLTEVCRGGPYDAAVERLLASGAVGALAITVNIAKRAGALLTAARLGSAHAVDALVVATAMEFTRAVIATGDGDDLRRLAASAPAVRVFDL